MQIIERLEPHHIEQLHRLYTQEWWTYKRTFEEPAYYQEAGLQSRNAGLKPCLHI